MVLVHPDRPAILRVQPPIALPVSARLLVCQRTPIRIEPILVALIIPINDLYRVRFWGYAVLGGVEPLEFAEPCKLTESLKTKAVLAVHIWRVPLFVCCLPLLFASLGAIGYMSDVDVWTTLTSGRR